VPPVIALILRSRALNDNTIGSKLRGRDLDSLVGVSVTGEPTAKGRNESDFFVWPPWFLEKNNDVLGFQGWALMLIGTTVHV
jgi:hypothetical protein